MNWFTGILQYKQPKESDPPSLIAAIITELEVKRDPRDPKELHASDLTREGFCAREVALYMLTGTKKKLSTIDTALAVTYDLGNAVSDLVREEWLGDRAIGDWRCQKCGAESKFSPKPAQTVSGCYHRWRYEEVVFEHPLGWTGSIDVFAKLDHELLTVTEVKILTPVDFEGLAGPLAEHRIRTALYLRLIADSAHPQKGRIRQDIGRVLYVSRAFGKKHPDYNDRILPFKEFVVDRDDASLVEIMNHAGKVALFKKHGKLPGRPCEQSWHPRAKNCGVVAACFSGKYH